VALSGYGVLYFAANRSLYFPMKYPRGFWEGKAEIGAEDVWIDTEDNVKLHGWLVRRPDAPFVALHLHGNAGNITHRVHVAREVTAAGASILLLDYRGYGRSQGWPTEKGLYADARASYRDLLSKGWKARQIVVHGESLGSAAAVQLASENECGGLVLEAPFSSARDVAARVLPILGPALVFGFDSLSRIGRVRAPILVIHGDRDEVIPFDLGRKLFDAAPEPKSFWAVNGGHHNDILMTAGARYREALREFYGTLAR
jgi:fermentation-respiration switch protein FrsA (DUF1100 family)